MFSFSTNWSVGTHNNAINIDWEKGGWRTYKHCGSITILTHILVCLHYPLSPSPIYLISTDKRVLPHISNLCLVIPIKYKLGSLHGLVTLCLWSDFSFYQGPLTRQDLFFKETIITYWKKNMALLQNPRYFHSDSSICHNEHFNLYQTFWPLLIGSTNQ